MASIQKRGKKYSVVYYSGEGSERRQIWKSGLNYIQAKALKSQIEKEQKKGTYSKYASLIVEEFLAEFVEKYGKKKWASSTMAGNIGLLNNYVYPPIGKLPLEEVKVKTIDDYYDFSVNEFTSIKKTSRDILLPSEIEFILEKNK